MNFSRKIVMDEDKTVVAQFSEVPANNPTHNLTMSVEGRGTTIPAPGVHEYEEGTEVEITAIPDEGWQFDQWVINGGTTPPPAGIIDAQVSAGPDDSYEEEWNGHTKAGDAILYSIADFSPNVREWVALKWDVNIPQGVTIAKCWVEAWGFDRVYSDINCDVHFELNGNPAPFTGIDYDVTSRVRTLASVKWQQCMATRWGRTDSLIAGLQEVVDAHAVDSLVVILKPRADMARQICKLASFEYAHDLAAKIHIEWE